MVGHRRDRQWNPWQADGMERNLDHALGQMLDERAITKVMHDYTRFVDFGQAEHISELFTD